MVPVSSQMYENQRDFHMKFKINLLWMGHFLNSLSRRRAGSAFCDNYSFSGRQDETALFYTVSTPNPKQNGIIENFTIVSFRTVAA